MSQTIDIDQIHRSRENDIWEIIEGTNGFSWRRTASNHEIVGGSHTVFSTREECEENARLVGYEGTYNAPSTCTWDLYTDAKGEHRWSLVTENGEKLNVSHEGYKTELSAKKNIIRHQSVATPLPSALPVTPPVTPAPVVSDVIVKQPEDSLGCIWWLLILILLALLFYLLSTLLFSGRRSEVTTLPDAIRPITTRTQLAPTDDLAYFNDIPEGVWYEQFVEHIANKNIIEGYKHLDGSPTGEYGPSNNITLDQLAKIAVLSANINLTKCSGNQEVAGANWSAPYIVCAKSKNWRVFSTLVGTSNRVATRGEVAATITDAFGLEPAVITSRFNDVNENTAWGGSIQQLAATNIVSGYANQNGTPTGNFGPNDPVNRAQVAKIVYHAMQL